MTTLERALAMLQSKTEDPSLFSALLQRLTDAEVFVALEKNPSGRDITPKTVLFENLEYVAIYDTEERLSEASGTGTEYIGVSGRGLVQMLVGQGTGIALNPGSSALGYVFLAQTVEWLAATLNEKPNEIYDGIKQISAPAELKPKVLNSLSEKLASAQGLADFACLVEAVDFENQSMPMICFVGDLPGAEADLAKLMQEFLQFSEYEDRDWTVTYLAPDHDMIDKILKVGLRFDLPKHGPDTGKVTENARTTPGSVPGKPPIFS